jgi:hypothetical protein
MMPKKFKITLEAMVEVEDDEDGLRELNNLYLFTQSGAEIKVSKVRAVEEISWSQEVVDRLNSKLVPLHIPKRKEV